MQLPRTSVGASRHRLPDRHRGRHRQLRVRSDEWGYFGALFCEDGDEQQCRRCPVILALSVIQDHGRATEVAAQTKQGRVVGFADLSGFNQPGGEFARSLYRSVALRTVAALGASVAGVGVATTL